MASCDFRSSNGRCPKCHSRQSEYTLDGRISGRSSGHVSLCTWINRTSASRLATTSDPGACSARNFVIVEMPDTFVGVQLFIVSNLPLAVQLPYFNLIFIPPGRRNEMTLSRIAEGMTAEQRELYGKTFDTFAATLNKMQDSGLDSASAARRVIELAEQVPAP